MKKWILTAICLMLVFLQITGTVTCTAEDQVPAASTAAAEQAEVADSTEHVPDVEAGIYEIKKSGNIVLSIGAESMKKLGYEPADIILVKIGDAVMEMPIGTSYTDVDSGKPICCFRTNSSGIEVVSLAINAGSLASVMGIAELRTIDADPGYEWVYADGLDADATVFISMAQKQGYADEYAMHQVSGVRTNNREDYANLSDEEYANFRAVETSGMGKDTLFRSSSPINPALNRNREADEALLRSLIQTVMNMSDSEEKMKKYADYTLTNYSACQIIALDMGMDFTAEDFGQTLAEGFRFLASHDGPYLIHCLEGKDRTGFAAAVLECLMGASAEEVVQDYMLTFYNFYGVEPGTQQYEEIEKGNLEVSLTKAFGIPSIWDDGVDLSACADTWLGSIGMRPEEISALKEKLSQDYGGLN